MKKEQEMLRKEDEINHKQELEDQERNGNEERIAPTI